MSDRITEYVWMQQIRVGQQKKVLFKMYLNSGCYWFKQVNLFFIVYDDFSLKVQIKFSTTQVISNCFAKKEGILKSL